MLGLRQYSRAWRCSPNARFEASPQPFAPDLSSRLTIDLRGNAFGRQFRRVEALRQVEVGDSPGLTVRRDSHR